MKLQDIIIFENESLIAINKPSGLLSIPDREGSEPSLKDLLKDYLGEIFTIHRLDRDTSGLIIFGKTPEAHKHFSRQFEERKTEKFYYGLVLGSLQPEEGSINAPIAENTVRKGTMLIHRRGKEAITDFEVLQDFGIYSLVQFQIHTGRTHQIRVHSKELGHPIAVDPIYGDGNPILLSSFKSKFKLGKYVLDEKPLLNRLALHAFQLNIFDENNTLISLEAPLSKDFKATVQQLEKWRTRKA